MNVIDFIEKYCKIKIKNSDKIESIKLKDYQKEFIKYIEQRKGKDQSMTSLSPYFFYLGIISFAALIIAKLLAINLPNDLSPKITLPPS